MKKCHYFLGAVLLYVSPIMFGMQMDAAESEEWLAANRKNFLLPGMSRKEQDWTLMRCALMTHEALHRNAAQGNVEWVEKLIKEYEFPVDLLNGNSETPLQVAAEAGQFAVIDVLMIAGANVFKCVNYQTVLQKIGRKDVLDYLFEHYPHTKKS